jgi:hypothetical protein
VLYNQGTNWSVQKRWPIEDGQLNERPDIGRRNGDGRADLVLLLKITFICMEDHLWPNGKIPSPASSSVQVSTLRHQRNDLLLVGAKAHADPLPVASRTSTPAEVYFNLAPIHAYQLMHSKPNKTQIVTIAQNSGRAQISEFTRKPAEPFSGAFKQGEFQVWPLNKTDKARRGCLWADVNGDARPDLLVAEPERGQLSVYFQKPDGSLAAPRAFPSLAGVSDIAVADWDGDGKPEIFLLSVDERQVAVARFGERESPISTLIPFEGKPRLGGWRIAARQAALAVIVDRDGKRSLVTRMADGKTKTQKLSEDFRSNPSTLAIHDIKPDGLLTSSRSSRMRRSKCFCRWPARTLTRMMSRRRGPDIAQPWFSRRTWTVMANRNSC